LDSAYKADYVIGYMIIPTRKIQETDEDMSKNSDSSSTLMPPIKRLKLEDDGSVEPNQSSSSNSSYDSDSTGPPPSMLHRCDSWSSSDSSCSASSNDEVELEIEREEVQRDLLPIYNVRGNELPVAHRACILCGELNHTYKDCPVQQELSLYVWLCLI
jgi:hypothetical protein